MNMIAQVVVNVFVFLLDGLIHLIAIFASRILSHPSVQDAGASIIVAGAKKLCLEEDLDEHFQALSETLKQHMERDAQQAGHDFPKVLSSFVKGMIIKPPSSTSSRINQQQTTTTTTNNNNTSSTTTTRPTSPPSVVIANSSDDDEASTDTTGGPTGRRSVLQIPDLRGSKKVQ